MKYDVFISFKRGALDGSGLTRDYEMAYDLHKTLQSNGINSFFSDKDLSTSYYKDELDEALDEAKVLVAVGTKREHLESPNVKYEWISFDDDILQGLKKDGEIYTYLGGISEKQLPRRLRMRQSFSPDNKAELVRWVKRNLGMEENQPVPPESKPVPVPVPPEPKLDVHVGGIVKFGQYPQGANGEVKPIEWRVLDIKDGKVLLLTEKLLDYVSYNEEYTKVTWETCTLRKWMNNDFIRKAFSSDEQRKIATVTNANPNNPKYGTKGGNPTQDKVFALSMDEVKRYFLTDKSMKVYTTDYAHKQDHDWIDRSDRWWLRSPGRYSDYAAYVISDGGVHVIGSDVYYYDVAARLALWLNL